MITILYAIFKTTKNIGRLTHLGYVAAHNPHDAIDKYLHEKYAKNPDAIVAIPISGNKFTCYYKRKTDSPKRVWRNRILTRLYDKVDHWDLKIPLDHRSWHDQLNIIYHGGRDDGRATIKIYK